MNKQQVVFVSLCLGMATQVRAEQLDPILVEDTALVPETTEVSVSVETLNTAPVETAELLRDIPGVSGSRLGGHGIDPVIRGQSQTRLNVMLDGAYVHGGCPNRMDPPTAYAPLDTYDEVTVIKGFQTVRYGGGGSGGTVLLERNTKPLTDEKPFRAKLSGGYQSNSETKTLSADVTAGTSQGFARGLVSYADANNYQDGDGNSVRSAYETKTGTMILGWTPDADTRLEGSFEANRERDVLFAGAGMDAPVSDQDSYRVRFSRKNISGLVSGIQAELYHSDVDHEMDNFSLRTLTAPMKMWVPTSSNTRGGRVSGDVLGGNGWLWTFGIDYQHNNRDADRYAGASLSTLQSVMWPDVDLQQSGLFAETSIPVGLEHQIKAGLRYDYVTSDAGRANQQTATVAGINNPNDLYRYYYGKSAEKVTEHNLSGLLRYEHSIGHGDSFVFASIARTLRTADATERFLAGNAGPATDGSFPNRWVGNPGLDPERHLQTELGVSWDGEPWQLGASIFYDRVKDYILRDRAHGQDGILQADNATIYRNVDARLWGVELDGSVNWAPNLSSKLGIGYVEARNTEDDQWIAQTPPLEGTLSLDYHQTQWQVGSRLRFAHRQNKVDDDINTGSGQDAEKTPGWGAIDLYGKMRLAKGITLDAGVNNLFDKTYAYHVNRTNVDPFNPEAIQVNEPGRSLWLNLSGRF